MKTIFLLLLTTTVGILISCDIDKRNKLSIEKMPLNALPVETELAANERAPETSASSDPLKHQKIIREGSIAFETKDLKMSRAYIATLCKEFASYIQAENNRHTDDQLTTETTLRIPTDQYDEVVAKLEAHAYDLTVKNIRVVDVTEQYVDIQARLKTKYELEQRFLSLIKKAKNVEEVLSVEAQLSQVRYEIESMEGKMRSLNDRIAFSTLNVSFYQVIQLEQVKPPTYLSKLAVAFRSGWDNLLSIFVGLVFLWPFIIFFTIGVFLTMKWKRRHRAETPQTT
jgi:viroplasmin and RNaseH domain-containing protein